MIRFILPAIRSFGSITRMRLAAHAWVAFFSMVTTLAAQEAAERERRKPNIVVVLADDLGYADVSCYGGKIPTPHIDRLASEGMRLTDAHTTSSVCSPTRYSLLTGRYNWRSKLQSGVLGGLSPRLIEPDRMTIASLLKGEGYHTACFGKWHLGMNWAVQPGKDVAELNIESRQQVFHVDYAKPIAQGPNSVGFDYYFGIAASLDMVPYTFIENDHVVSLPTEDRDFPMMHDRTPKARTRKGPTAPDFDAADVLPMLARKSVEYIDSRARDSAQGQPFFMYVPLASPHTPILPTGEWQGKSGINPYADFVMQTDAAVGEILQALERNQLSENTLVIFTSDNGGLSTSEGWPTSNSPLRGGKGWMYEGGIREPFLVRWPRVVKADSKVKPGSVNRTPISSPDLFPTLLQAAGAQPQAEQILDGVSLVPVLEGNSLPERALFWHYPHYGNQGGAPAAAIRRGDWKLIEWHEDNRVELFQLADDLGEQSNLAAGEPERVRMLQAELHAWQEEVGAHFPIPNANYDPSRRNGRFAARKP